MNDSLNKFLAEWMGECWHEWVDQDMVLSNPIHKFKCTKCNLERLFGHPWETLEYPDYTTPEGFFRLWERAKGSEGWEKFCHKHGGRIGPIGKSTIGEWIISPKVFPREWAKFLGWKEE